MLAADKFEISALTTSQIAFSQRKLSGLREQVSTRIMFLIAGFSLSSWAPLVPFAKSRIGLDDASLGLLLLCLGAGSIVAMPVTGGLTARFGCRIVFSTAVVILGVVLPVLVLADTWLILGPALAIFGACIGTMDVAMNIQAVMVEKHSGRNLMSGFHGLFSVGGVLGAGGVALLLGMGIPVVTCTIIASAAILVMLAGAWGGLLSYGDEGEPSALFVWPRGLVLLIAAMCFVAFLAEGAVLDWSALFLITEHGIDAAQAGFGYSLFAVTMTIGRLFGDRVVAWAGGSRVIIVGGLVSALGFALSVFAPNQSLVWVGLMLVGIGAANIVPILFTAAGRQTDMPASMAIAAVTTVGYAGILAGAGAIGVIAGFWGYSAAFLLLGAAMALVAVNGWVARR